MAKLSLEAGASSLSLYVFIQDSASINGSGKTGLVYNSSGLKAYYVRPRAAAVAISLVTQTVTGGYSSGGFVEVDSTNMPGVYRLDLPNAAVAAGADSAVIMLSGAVGMAPLVLEVELKSGVAFTVGTGSTTTSVVTSACTPAASDSTQFTGRIIEFAADTTTAALRGKVARVLTNTVSATPTLTIATGDLPTAPVSGDRGRM